MLNVLRKDEIFKIREQLKHEKEREMRMQKKKELIRIPRSHHDSYNDWNTGLVKKARLGTDVRDDSR